MGSIREGCGDVKNGPDGPIRASFGQGGFEHEGGESKTGYFLAINMDDGDGFAIELFKGWIIQDVLVLQPKPPAASYMANHLLDLVAEMAIGFSVNGDDVHGRRYGAVQLRRTQAVGGGFDLLGFIPGRRHLTKLRVMGTQNLIEIGL